MFGMSFEWIIDNRMCAQCTKIIMGTVYDLVMWCIRHHSFSLNCELKTNNASSVISSRFSYHSNRLSIAHATLRHANMNPNEIMIFSCFLCFSLCDLYKHIYYTLYIYCEFVSFVFCGHNVNGFSILDCSLNNITHLFLYIFFSRFFLPRLNYLFYPWIPFFMLRAPHSTFSPSHTRLQCMHFYCLCSFKLLTHNTKRFSVYFRFVYLLYIVCTAMQCNMHVFSLLLSLASH